MYIQSLPAFIVCRGRIHSVQKADISKSLQSNDLFLKTTSFVRKRTPSQAPHMSPESLHRAGKTPARRGAEYMNSDVPTSVR